MKNLTFTLFLICLTTTTMFAQQFDLADQNTMAAVNANANIQQKSISTIYEEEEEEMGQDEIKPLFSIIYKKQPKSIKASFTGFKVQLMISTEKLENNHAIFTDFGAITLEEINGTYYYTIGNFSSPTKANDFAQRVVANRYAVYKIVEYQKGKRMTINAN